MSRELPEFDWRRVDPAGDGAAGSAVPRQIVQGAGLSVGPAPRELPWTKPGPRPVVYQEAQNLQIPVTASAAPIMPGSFAADGIILSVPAGGNPVFFGYGSSLVAGSGIQIAASQPVLIAPSNSRELWEIQRVLEAMYASMTGQPLQPWKAPRVAMDLNKWYLVCSAGLTQTVGAIALYIPDAQ